jgi:hypothetical protein
MVHCTCAVDLFTEDILFFVCLGWDGMRADHEWVLG